MIRNGFSLAPVIVLATLLAATDAQAWGAYHAGYTHVGPAGVYHYGRTAAVGPYGGYSGAHAGFHGYGGGVAHAGYGGAYHYGGYGGYHYGGLGYGGAYGGYRGGYYRRW